MCKSLEFVYLMQLYFKFISNCMIINFNCVHNIAYDLQFGATISGLIHAITRFQEVQ